MTIATLSQNKKMKSIVVIVTWNRLDLLKPLLESLKKQKDKDFGIIVVDNGSSDGTLEFLTMEAKRSYSNELPLWAIFLNSNTGFSVPNNLALTFALEFLDFDNFILLNNDTLPEDDFIKVLHEKAKSYLTGSDQNNLEIEKKLFPFLSQKDDWKVGSFAPLVENFYAKGRVDAAGIKIYPDGNAINRGMGERIFQYNREKEVFGPSGSAAFYFRKALADVALPPQKIAILKGMDSQDTSKERVWNVRLVNYNKKIKGVLLPVKEFFSSRHFLYFEDVDLAFRLRLRYWGCVYLPKAKILHRHSATSKAYSPFKSYFVHRNQYFNIIRDFPSYLILVGFANAIKRYFYLLRSLRIEKGPAAMVAKNSSKMTVFGIVIRGWASILKNLVGLIKDRFYIQSHRLISPPEFNKLINASRFRASIEKMIFETQDFLKEQKKNDGEDRDRAA